MTPTQRAIFDILSDGINHPEKDLLRALDDQADRRLLSVHIHNLRKVILPYGYDVVRREGRYRLVMHIRRRN